MGSYPRQARAALVTAYGRPLEVRELPVPQPLEPGGMLVRIDVASVCGSDVHLWEGQLDYLVTGLPVIAGHEMVGRIVDLGERRTDFCGAPLHEGDRILWAHGTCKRCYYCRVLERPVLCEHRRWYMYTSCRDYPYLVGGFAEYCYVFPESDCVRIPDEVKSEWASASACAFRSLLHGFRRLGPLEDADTVVIQGSGPIGLFSTVLARDAGCAQIIVIGDPEARRAVARAWGAHATLSVSEMAHPERLEAVRRLTGGRGADVVIEASGARTAVAEGFDLARPGGRYLIIGTAGPEVVPLAPSWITRKELTVIGSWSADIVDYYLALEFLRHKREVYDWDLILTNRYDLSQVTEALVAMREMEEIKPLVLP